VLDVRIRKVRVLKGELGKMAKKRGFKPEDLVVVKTRIEGGVPRYELERIEGDPVSWMLRRVERG